MVLDWLNRLTNQLLICLDELDEYGSLDQSPFKSFLGGTLQKRSTQRAIRLIVGRLVLPCHHLLIASRRSTSSLFDPKFFCTKI